MIESISQAINQTTHTYPLYLSTIAAGFPSPADDYIEAKLDLNELLIKHPAATFFVRVKGHSMRDAGIHEKDILIVDRSLSPTNGNIVIAAIDGQLTVKRLKKTNNRLFLVPENTEFSAIEITADNDMCIWGVVTNVIHAV